MEMGKIMGNECKEGDLAYVFRSTCGNEMKIVTCVKYYLYIDISGIRYTRIWEVDTYLNCPDGVRRPFIGAGNLKPIRPDESEDEMLLIIKVKEKESCPF